MEADSNSSQILVNPVKEEEKEFLEPEELIQQENPTESANFYSQGLTEMEMPTRELEWDWQGILIFPPTSFPCPDLIDALS